MGELAKKLKLALAILGAFACIYDKDSQFIILNIAMGRECSRPEAIR